MKPTSFFEDIFKRFDSSLILPGIAGLVAAFLVLVLTLNLLAAFLVFILVLASLIFYKSFSWGWLFLLGIILLFPAVSLNKAGLNLFDFLLSVLALLGMIQLAIKDKKVLRNKLSFYFFLLFLIALVGGIAGKIFSLSISREVWQIALNLLMIWALLIGFQYFFQTQKRIKKFFLVVVLAAAVHSVFSIAVFSLNLQPSSGIGVTAGKDLHPVFSQVDKRVNGFLGIGLQERTGSNPLAPFLCAGILISAGFFFLEERKRKVFLKRRKNNLRIQKVLKADQVKKLFLKLKRGKSFRKSITWFFLGLVQFIALFLTFSYYSLIYLGIGFLIMGILFKNKRIISSSIVLLLSLIIIIPSLISSGGDIFSVKSEDWFEGFNYFKDNWVLGKGIVGENGAVLDAGESVENSYLLVWSTYGIAGIVVFAGMLWQYFIEIYRKYESSKNGERVWFIVIVSVFGVFLLEGLSGNILIFGPTAVIFWLMYGIILNLGNHSLKSRFKKINYQ